MARRGEEYMRAACTGGGAGSVHKGMPFMEEGPLPPEMYCTEAGRQKEAGRYVPPPA